MRTLEYIENDLTSCIFSSINQRCAILTATKCPKNCAFKKSLTEYLDGMLHAEEILREKGLKRVMASIDNNEIVTTKKE